jgi:hypothetical protein
LYRCRLAAKDLRREIQRRAGESRRPALVAQFLARPEVHQDGAPAALAQDVLGLDVPVQKACAVDRCECGAEVLTDDRRLRRAEGAARSDDLLERLSADELHPQADASVVLFGAIYVHDIRMAYTGQPTRFLQDARVRFCRRIRGAMLAQQLECHFAMQFRVPRSTDVPGGAPADLLEHHQPSPSRPLRLRDRCRIDRSALSDVVVFVERNAAV